MDVKFIYSSEYDLIPTGLEFLHPFDGKKFSRAWELLFASEEFDAEAHWVKPEVAASDDYLANIHTPEYLQSLKKSSVIAQIIEIGLVRFIPNSLLQSQIIKPMRLACEGTRLATEYALKGALAMNVGGGFHHAFTDHGEGFCVFADAALAIDYVRKSGLLKSDDTIVMIDLDAHRGNGFQAIFAKDPAVRIFDMFNFQVYPGMFEGDMDQYPFMIPLKAHSSDEVYLGVLKEELPGFLAMDEPPKLAFYNAGSDILASDPLGNLGVSYDGVIERDKYVIESLVSRGIPTVIMTSGGYTKQSYQLIAALAQTVIRKTGGRSG